jgi:hypothetical protein
MFNSPTLVDLDADGKMEIIVGTSVGFVYVLDHKVGGGWGGGCGGQGARGEGVGQGGVGGTVGGGQGAGGQGAGDMFSSPTLVELDADGKMQIIVGTNVGFVYILDHKVGGGGRGFWGGGGQGVWGGGMGAVGFL